MPRNGWCPPERPVHLGQGRRPGPRPRPVSPGPRRRVPGCGARNGPGDRGGWCRRKARRRRGGGYSPGLRVLPVRSAVITATPGAAVSGRQRYKWPARCSGRGAARLSRHGRLAEWPARPEPQARLGSGDPRGGRAHPALPRGRLGGRDLPRRPGTPGVAGNAGGGRRTRVRRERRGRPVLPGAAERRVQPGTLARRNARCSRSAWCRDARSGRNGGRVAQVVRYRSDGSSTDPPNNRVRRAAGPADRRPGRPVGR
ncbi:hypothetical protein HBB16_21330 [Pseudonocardia sp. MCCB 268]|nr:hypothetical protein [Pseudonocardia cytotoxica]